MGRISDLSEPNASSKYVVESGQPLSRSLLWAIQRRYFEDRGIEAWRRNIVPSYITSNPYIAQSYARVVLGYLRDCLPALDPSQPVYLVELGAGGGRFAFHFMRKFEALLAQSPFADLRFCYVLTDLPERNLEFWQQHPALQAWMAAGKLDLARFDAVADREIHLRRAGQTITPGSLKNPLILLANYFFDSIPQDAFHVEEGRLQECRINLTSAQAEPDPTAPEVLPRLMIHFMTQDMDHTGYYHDPDLDAILEQYRTLQDSYLLFPAEGIRLLRELERLAGGRMLLIAGDFGVSSAQEWDHNGAPDIRIHGSISMEVNFHALGAYIQNRGGCFLTPGFFSPFLSVCAFALGEDAQSFTELQLAYTEAIVRGGPNDFFLLKRGMENNFQALNLDEMLGFLRFSGWDGHLFLDYFEALLEKAPAADARRQEEVARALGYLWDNYYHLGEERDLPFNIGVILFRMGRVSEALTYFERSLQYYGPSPSTLYNVALCLTKEGKFTLALERLQEALAIDPQFEPALSLAKEVKKKKGH